MMCFRCKKRAMYSTWNVCADRNRRRPLCWRCDVSLNRLVLRWMHYPNWQMVAERYAVKMQQERRA